MNERPLFQVDADVFDQFPDYIVGCVLVSGIRPEQASVVESALAIAELRARASYDGVDLKSEPPFAAWRDAFSQAGWSPSRFPASVEALHKRLQRSGAAPRINPAVDLANATALYYSAPVGTHDVRSFAGKPLEVRRATPSDQFVDMQGQLQTDLDGEIVYAIGNDVRTRRWVWRQGQRGLVGSGAADIFFPIDGFKEQTLNQVDAAVNFLAEVCRSELCDDVQTGTVDIENPAFWPDR